MVNSVHVKLVGLLANERVNKTLVDVKFTFNSLHFTIAGNGCKRDEQSERR